MKFILIIGAFLLLFSCSKSGTDDMALVNRVDSLVNAPVHTIILGTKGDQGDTLVVWKDDTLKLLHTNNQTQSYAIPGQIITSGQDIYIAGGSENNKAVYYKNFVKTTLAQYYSYASSIAVANGSVYVAGFSMDNNGTNYGETYVTFWKDGIRYTQYGANTQYNQVAFKNNDMYLLGFSNANSYGYGPMIFLKNNSPISLSNFNAQPKRIAFKNDTAYVVGNIYFNSYEPHATLWKNGQEISLQSLVNFSEANAICIQGNDVYIAGVVDNSATYWKNGVRVILAGNGSNATDIKVVNDDVYVVGQAFDNTTLRKVAVVWKNGIMKWLSNPNRNSNAFSIVVQ
jgi:hypothetical protein